MRKRGNFKFSWKITIKSKCTNIHGGQDKQEVTYNDKLNKEKDKRKNQE